MLPAAQSFLAGFPILLLHLAVTLGLLAAAAVLYTRLTVHDEIALIRQGNVAAAISFSGAVLGLAIPLAFCLAASFGVWDVLRSEEHTSELQSLMRNSYAVFCLKKKRQIRT